MSKGKLVLTRKAGESVKIGEHLLLTVREVHPAKVYVGFTENGVLTPVWLGISHVVRIPTEHGEMRLLICAINKGIVKLLFEAERSVRIVRSELVE